MNVLLIPIYLVLAFWFIVEVCKFDVETKKRQTKINEYWKCEARDEWRGRE